MLYCDNSLGKSAHGEASAVSVCWNKLKERRVKRCYSALLGTWKSLPC